MIKSDRVLLHHPVGEGEYHTPIKPFWTTTSQFVIPTIEEALFGEFTRKKHHRMMAAAIFHDSIEVSRGKLVHKVNSASTVDFLHNLSNACRSKVVLDALGDSSSSSSAPSAPSNVNPPAWTPRLKMPSSDQLAKYTYWATVWIRINCTFSLLEYAEDLKHVKATQFMNAHIPVIRYLDGMDDPSDERINIHVLCSLYGRLGKSRFDEDRNLIRIETSKIQLRLYPLQVLEKRFPDRIWRPNDVVSVNVGYIRSAGYGIDGMEGDHFLMACLWIMVQCRDLHRVEEDMGVRDYLWFYHCCFLDVVAGKAIGGLVPQLLFPYDSRCFTAYDLPDTFHVLSSMPLWGEQLVPTFPIGKFIQKSLPFAGARRTLIDTTDKNISSDTTFWKLFSSLFFCMLIDTYPEHISRNRERCFDLQRLLAIVRLVGNRNLLKEMLSRKSFKTPQNAATFNKENDKGCYIVFTAFRLWLLMMVHGQYHYQQAISGCLDWKLFFDETVAMARVIRVEMSAPIGADISTDVFAKPREILKGAKNKIYRYRKSNVVDTVLGNMMEGLEKHLFKELDDWEVRMGKSVSGTSATDAFPPLSVPTQSKFISQFIVSALKYEIPIDIKTNLLNLLIHVPKSMWIDPLTLSIMRVPEYGGITEFPIAMILKLIDIYFNNSAKPKEFEHFISLFDTGVEFKIISWFFHVLHILDGVDFELLLDSQTEQIDMAMMTTRYVLYPGQILPQTAFNVFFTICCGKIKTLVGSSAYGHEDIAYDANRRTYICAKSQKKVQSYNSDDMAFSEYERVKKQARKQRKDFNFMPCKDNPVLCIDLRGFMLIWGKDTR